MRPLLALSLFYLLSITTILSQESLLPDEVRVSYSTEFSTLPDILIALSERSGVNIAFSNEIIPDTVLDLRVASRPLGQILNNLISEFGLKYQIVGDQIVIVKDPYAGLEDSYTISGVVEDSISGEKLIFASIFLHHEPVGVISNHYGFYSLSISPGEYLIHFRYLGYEEKVLKISVTQDTSLNVLLKPDALLHEIVIRDKLPGDKKYLYDPDDIPMEKVHGLTGLAGETDLVRTSLLLPGISSGADGFGGLNVRGGSQDQNLILLDGAPIYNLGHSLGIFSIFNPEIINKAMLIRGPIPAKYGGRLSSVLDVRTREGNLKHWQGGASISALAGRLTVEGPLAKDKSSLLFSFRRTILDPWIKEFTKYQNEQNGNSGSANYYFYDFNGKINIRISDRSRVFLSVYQGADKFNSLLASADESSSIQINELSNDIWDWGNRMASLRWTLALGKKSFLNWTSNISRFKFQQFHHDRREELIDGEDMNLYYDASLYNSEIEDISSQLDLESQLSPKYRLNTGIKVIQHKFRPGLQPVSRSEQLFPDTQILEKQDLEEILSVPEITGEEFALYLDNIIKLNSAVQLDLGVHLAGIRTDQENFLSIQPRAALQAWLGKSAIFRASFAKMHQYLHLLTDSGFGLPSDVWLPSTDQLKPEESWQADAGFQFFPGNKWSIGFGGYFKKMEHLITYSDQGIVAINQGDDWSSEIPVGSGTAYGIEASIEKKAGKLTGWINYTLGWSKRKFSDINGGEEFFARFDRRHNFKTGIVFRINQNSEFTFNWQYGTGSRVTLIDQIFRLNDSTLVINYQERNQGRLPAFHRLDFAFNLYNKYSWGQQKISIGLYNAYNRKNPIYLDIDRSDTNLENFVTKSVSIFPIIPSISYNLSF